MHINKTAPLAIAMAFSHVVCADWDPSEAASKLPDKGEYHLALFNNEARDGFMRLGWYHEGDTLVVYDRTMMPSAEVYETYRATMNAQTLAPESVSISFHQGTAILGIDANLGADGIHGQRSVSRIGQDPDISEISAEPPAGTILRALTFILPLVLETTPGQEVSYDWFSPLTGQVERVTLSPSDGGVVETPAGSFETTLWALRGGNPENDIYVTRGEKSQIVRIDVIGQPLQFLATSTGM